MRSKISKWYYLIKIDYSKIRLKVTGIAVSIAGNFATSRNFVIPSSRPKSLAFSISGALETISKRSSLNLVTRTVFSTWCAIPCKDNVNLTESV